MLIYIFVIRDELSGKTESFSCQGEENLERKLETILRTHRGKEVFVDTYDPLIGRVIGRKEYHTYDKKQEHVYYCDVCMKKIVYGEEVYTIYDDREGVSDHSHGFCSKGCATEYQTCMIRKLTSNSMDYRDINWSIQDVEDNEE